MIIFIDEDTITIEELELEERENDEEDTGI